MTYTVSLALVDFLPVAFTIVGMYFVARMAGLTGEWQGRMAMLGAFLVVAGGLCKAIWKLLMATTNGTVDIVWMDEGLFVWMAPGFVFLAWAMWGAMQEVRGRSLRIGWPIPLGVIAVLFVSVIYMAFTRPQARTWNLILLGVMTLASVITGILLIMVAIRLNKLLEAGLFGLNLVGVFVLNGLARIEEQTIVLQWIEESINTFSWLFFAFAAWRIYQRAYATLGAQVETGQMAASTEVAR